MAKKIAETPVPTKVKRAKPSKLNSSIGGTMMKMTKACRSDDMFESGEHHIGRPFILWIAVSLWDTSPDDNCVVIKVLMLTKEDDGSIDYLYVADVEDERRHILVLDQTIDEVAPAFKAANKMHGRSVKMMREYVKAAKAQHANHFDFADVP